MRATYEATICQRTKANELPVFNPDDLVVELRREFANYCATHTPSFKKTVPPHAPHGKPETSSYANKGKGVDRTQKSTSARAAAAPYAAKLDDKTTRKCYNCNELGHTTPTCPKPWTEKSKEAMKKKGFTRKSIAAATPSASASAAVVQPAPAQASSSTSIQSNWVATLSSSDVTVPDNDVVMHVSTLIPSATPLFVPLLARASRTSLTQALLFTALLIVL